MAVLPWTQLAQLVHVGLVHRQNHIEAFEVFVSNLPCTPLANRVAPLRQQCPGARINWFATAPGMRSSRVHLDCRSHTRLCGQVRGNELRDRGAADVAHANHQYPGGWGGSGKEHASIVRG